MAFCSVQFRSSALEKACSMNVILPEAEAPTGRYPVYYLLHGLSDDHTIWCRRTSIERYVQSLPLIVVMPDGGRSFYCDAVSGPRYETLMIEDVIGFVDRFFPTIASREGRVIGGLSMGGYGSMKLALKFPDQFCSVVAHSSCHNIARRPVEELSNELRLILGSEPANGKDDLFAIVENAELSKLPAIRFDCGVDDFLLDDNRLFHQHLESLNIPHEYEEFPGEHSWAYWDVHVQEAIAFHCKALGINGGK